MTDVHHGSPLAKLVKEALRRFESGDFVRAEQLCRDALAKSPVQVDALNILGLILRDRNEPAGALEFFTKAVNVAPTHAWSLMNQGLAFLALKRFAQAADSLRQCVTQKPLVNAYLGLGFAEQKLGRFEVALGCFESAIEIAPQLSEPHTNRGMLLQKLGRYTEALAEYQKVVAMEPRSAAAQTNLGIQLKLLDRPNEAIDAFTRALELQPHFPIAEYYKAITLLSVGRLSEAWPLHEARWTGSLDLRPTRVFKSPVWLGNEDIRGKTIMVYAEQGLGDQIWMARYVPMLSDLGAKVILESSAPLVDLFASLRGATDVYPVGTYEGTYDRQIPDMSLPLAFSTTLPNIPAHTPYLSTPVAHLEEWKRILGPRTRPRIGVVWQGGTLSNIKGRSIPLELFSELFSDSFEWISLHKELPTQDLEQLARKAQIRHFGSMHHDFRDAAAICDLVDLVISVDTSLAHLSGSLNRPTWTLLPYHADWRWMLNRSDSPWYPSMTLFRQHKSGDWTAVIEDVKHALSRSFSSPSGSINA